MVDHNDRSPLPAFSANGRIIRCNGLSALGVGGDQGVVSNLSAVIVTGLHAETNITATMLSTVDLRRAAILVPDAIWSDAATAGEFTIKRNRHMNRKRCSQATRLMID